MSEPGRESPTLDKRLAIGLILNSTFTLGELLVGMFVGSLALMSDAGHSFAHTLCLVIALAARKLSRLQANRTHTFGFRRTTILAALLNALILLLLALYILYEAMHRLFEPHVVPGLPLVVVAGIGTLLNGAIALLMRKHTHDLNSKSVFASRAGGHPGVARHLSRRTPHPAYEPAGHRPLGQSVHWTADSLCGVGYSLPGGPRLNGRGS